MEQVRGNIGLHDWKGSGGTGVPMSGKEETTLLGEQDAKPLEFQNNWVADYQSFTLMW